jgi:hypothetical protein
MSIWLLFQVPCPTPIGETAQDLLQKRYDLITPEMQESARSLGCRFHRAFAAEDGSAFWAIANWETREGAMDFFELWDIRDEIGEVAIPLTGDIGLVTET